MLLPWSHINKLQFLLSPWQEDVARFACLFKTKETLDHLSLNNRLYLKYVLLNLLTIFYEVKFHIHKSNESSDINELVQEKVSSLL